MKKISSKDQLTEKSIIDNYFKRLNFNKLETFNFDNDGAYINIPKNYKTIVTTDTIVENVDFFSKLGRARDGPGGPGNVPYFFHPPLAATVF